MLQRTVAERMNERLAFVKFQPAVILDGGCGTGYGQTLLKARYPSARQIGLDIAINMLRQTRGQPAWWKYWLPGRRPEAARWRYWRARA